MSNEKLQNMFIEDAPQDVNNLGGVESLSDLVIKLQKLEDEIEQDEQRLKLKKQNADQISQIAIPEIMESLKMKTMKLADGIGLAAPQIGKSFRVFVVDGTTLNDPEYSKPSSP